MRLSTLQSEDNVGGSDSSTTVNNFSVFVRVKPFSSVSSSISSFKTTPIERSSLLIEQQNHMHGLNSYSSGVLPSALSPNHSSSLSSHQPFFRHQQQQQQQQHHSPASTVLNIDEQSNSLTILDTESRNIDQREKTFSFDGVLKESTSNEDVFTRAVLPSLPHLLQGFNATFLAYGITGSGKTHTIFGDQGGRQIRSQPDPGICVQAISHLFQQLNPTNSSVLFSYLEIYNENVRDLLAQPITTTSITTNNSTSTLFASPNSFTGSSSTSSILAAAAVATSSSTTALSSQIPKNLTIIEDPYAKTISVQDLKEYPVTSAIEVERLIERGNQTRALAPTLSNTYSSRSHAILILQVVQRVSADQVITSKLTIIDLAGSEKSSLHKLGSFEGSNINKSLLALGNCISILSDKKRANSHVPYRDSKLTRILKDSLGGNTKTVMIACISQAPSSIDETLNTLNYAQRATNIKRKVHRNIATESDPIAQRELIADLQAQLLICRQKLIEQSCSSAIASNLKSSEHKTSEQASNNIKNILEERENVTRELRNLEKQVADAEASTNTRATSNEEEGDFLTRICDDLFQNVKESFQLTQGLSDIEAQLIRDYQELLLLRKTSPFTAQTQELITAVTQSISENEEIQERMRAVLNTNANQNSNLKLILHKITHNPLNILKAEIQLKKQRLEMLDVMEEKVKLEIRCEALENQLQKQQHKQSPNNYTQNFTPKALGKDLSESSKTPQNLPLKTLKGSFEQGSSYSNQKNRLDSRSLLLTTDVNHNGKAEITNKGGESSTQFHNRHSQNTAATGTGVQADSYIISSTQSANQFSNKENDIVSRVASHLNSTIPALTLTSTPSTQTNAALTSITPIPQQSSTTQLTALGLINMTPISKNGTSVKDKQHSQMRSSNEYQYMSSVQDNSKQQRTSQQPNKSESDTTRMQDNVYFDFNRSSQVGAQQSRMSDKLDSSFNQASSQILQPQPIKYKQINPSDRYERSPLNECTPSHGINEKRQCSTTSINNNAYTLNSSLNSKTPSQQNEMRSSLIQKQQIPISNNPASTLNSINDTNGKILNNAANLIGGSSSISKTPQSAAQRNSGNRGSNVVGISLDELACTERIMEKNLYYSKLRGSVCDSAAKINPLEAENELDEISQVHPYLATPVSVASSSSLSSIQQKNLLIQQRSTFTPGVPACSIDLNSISSPLVESQSPTSSDLLTSKLSSRTLLLKK